MALKRPCTLCRSAAFRLNAVRLLRRSDPTSPEAARLRLLPSGPDLVHGASPRGTRPSTPRRLASPTMPDLEREFNPAKAGCGYRAPLAPRLARPPGVYHWRNDAATGMAIQGATAGRQAIRWDGALDRSCPGCHATVARLAQ